LGGIVVVVGGRRVTVIVVGPGEDDFPSSPQSGSPPSLVPCVVFLPLSRAGDPSPSSPQPPTESLLTMGKGTVMLPPEVELLVIPP